MTDAERAEARAALIANVSLPRLIDQLESGPYGHLVEHVRRTLAGTLSAVADVHAELITECEAAAAAAVVDRVMTQAEDPSFWSATAGSILTRVSSELNDELAPAKARDAGICNLFQLLTTRFALRSEVDAAFRAIMLADHASAAAGGQTGSLTRTLGTAVTDFDAGRLSRKSLHVIFQAAIDNGDVLLTPNEFVVAAHVMPLIDAGILTPSPHISEFEQRMTLEAMSFLNAARPKRKRWWRFWG